MTLPAEQWPHVTWPAESAKPFSGELASSAWLRAFKAEMDYARSRMETTADKAEIDRVIGWLTKCLYSSNMENFPSGKVE